MHAAAGGGGGGTGGFVVLVICFCGAAGCDADVRIGEGKKIQGNGSFLTGWIALLRGVSPQSLKTIVSLLFICNHSISNSNCKNSTTTTGLVSCFEPASDRCFRSSHLISSRLISSKQSSLFRGRIDGLLQFLHHSSPGHGSDTASNDAPVVGHDDRDPVLPDTFPVLFHGVRDFLPDVFVPVPTGGPSNVRLRLVGGLVPKAAARPCERVASAVVRLVGHHQDVAEGKVHLEEVGPDERVLAGLSGSGDDDHVLLGAGLQVRNACGLGAAIGSDRDFEREGLQDPLALLHGLAHGLHFLLALEFLVDLGLQLGLFSQIVPGGKSHENDKTEIDPEVDELGLQIKVGTVAVGDRSGSVDETPDKGTRPKGSVEEQPKSSPGGDRFRQQFVAHGFVEAAAAALLVAVAVAVAVALVGKESGHGRLRPRSAAVWAAVVVVVAVVAHGGVGRDKGTRAANGGQGAGGNPESGLSHGGRVTERLKLLEYKAGKKKKSNLCYDVVLP
mmetsp:Transcript_1786/g.3909  ORF Transcript_1786/g.3909 Transcript_1786/m.3909 type:complete len:502 (+) Transcript_1786:66-1571(+)